MATRRRFAAALALVVLVALGAVGLARQLAHRGGPGPASDLDMPFLFDRKDLTEPRVLDDRPGGIPVLCYHYFRPGLGPVRMLRVLGAVLLNLPTMPDKDYWTTSVPELERQLGWLAARGYRSLTLDELADCLDGLREPPPRAVVLTIDDGDRTFVEHAVPVLRRHGFVATVFLLTGRAGERGWNDLDFADWDTLSALEREGIIRVESHTHRMHTKVREAGEWVPRFLLECRDGRGRVTRDSPLGRDLEASRAAIRGRLGRECRYLAWPFGYGEAEVDSLAHAVGIRRIFTLRPRRVRPEERIDRVGHPQDALGRFAITARTSFRAFRQMVEGPGGDAGSDGSW